MSRNGEKIAVLGAGGTMGHAMARNLAAAGFAVRAWNRSREKAADLADDGATVVEEAGQAVQGATVVLTMLPDADAVVEVMAGVEAPHAAVWLQMSTVGVDGAERCAEHAGRAGLVFVDAPVLGTKQPAEAGELVILASGPDDVRDRLAPLFDVIGKRTVWAGRAGAGSRLKVATNLWLVTVVEGAAEALALADGMGLDGAQVLDAVAGGPLDLPYLQTKGKAMLEGDFTPSFRLALAAKDAGLAEDAARASGLDLPLVSTIRARFDEGARAHPDDDLAATYLTARR
jgi:3-hydroxyisobutyrate dehydrogenase